MPSSLRRAFKAKSDATAESSPPSKSFFKRGRTVSQPSGKAGGGDPLDCSPSKLKRKIKTSDISLVLDISAENAAKLQGISEYSGAPFDDLEDGRSQSPPLIIDKELVDQFPLPPVVHAYSSPDVRIPVLPPSDALLPPLHPRVQQYMAEQKAARSRRQPIARSASINSYSRPTATAYSGLLQENSISRLPPSPNSHTAWNHGDLGGPYSSRSLSNRSSPHLAQYATDRPLLHRKSHSEISPGSLERPGRRTKLRARLPIDVAP